MKTGGINMSKNLIFDQQKEQFDTLYQNGELPVNLIETYQVFQDHFTCLRVQSLSPTIIIKLVEKEKRQLIQKLTIEMKQEIQRGQVYEEIIQQVKQVYDETHYYDIQKTIRWLEEVYHPCILTIYPEFEKLEAFLQKSIPEFTVNKNKETISMEEFLLQKVPTLASLFEQLLKGKDQYKEPNGNLPAQIYMSEHFDEIEREYNWVVNDLLKKQYKQMIETKKHNIFAKSSVMTDEQWDQSWDQVSLRQLQQWRHAQQQYVKGYQRKIQAWNDFQLTSVGCKQFIYDLFRIDENDIQQRIHATPWKEDRPSHHFRNQLNQLLKSTAQGQVIEDNKTQQDIFANKLAELPNRLDLLEKAQVKVYQTASPSKRKKPTIYKPTI